MKLLVVLALVSVACGQQQPGVVPPQVAAGSLQPTAKPLQGQIGVTQHQESQQQQHNKPEHTIKTRQVPSQAPVVVPAVPASTTSKPQQAPARQGQQQVQSTSQKPQTLPDQKPQQPEVAHNVGKRQANTELPHPPAQPLPGQTTQRPLTGQASQQHNVGERQSPPAVPAQVPSATQQKPQVPTSSQAPATIKPHSVGKRQVPQQPTTNPNVSPLQAQPAPPQAPIPAGQQKPQTLPAQSGGLPQPSQQHNVGKRQAES